MGKPGEKDGSKEVCMKTIGNEEMSIEHVSIYLNASVKTIQDWVQAGQIPTHRVGAYWLFQRKEIDSWLRSNIQRICSPQ